MSHNIEHFTYTKNVDKAAVQKELDNYVALEDWQEGCSGLYHNIRWLEDKVYDNCDDALEAIEKLDRGNYDQIAVLYNEISPRMRNSNGVDPKLAELEQKVREAEKEMNRRHHILYADTVTAAFIGCKECGSKLARKYIRGNACPVCSSDLRPEHMIKSFNVAKNRWLKAKENTRNYINRHGKKTVMWLVKIEYHT